MRRLWKVVLGCIAAGALYISAVLVFSRPWCDALEMDIANDNEGGSVVVGYTGCGSPGGGYIDLRRSSGRNFPLLQYAPLDNNENPSASWVSAKELRISMGPVKRVYMKQTEADGIHVTYDIGADLSQRER